MKHSKRKTRSIILPSFCRALLSRPCLRHSFAVVFHLMHTHPTSRKHITCKTEVEYTCTPWIEHQADRWIAFANNKHLWWSPGGRDMKHFDVDARSSNPTPLSLPYILWRERVCGLIASVSFRQHIRICPEGKRPVGLSFWRRCEMDHSHYGIWISVGCQWWL